MKIRVKVAYSCLTLPKKLPPLQNPDCAPEYTHVAYMSNIF